MTEKNHLDDVLKRLSEKIKTRERIQDNLEKNIDYLDEQFVLLQDKICYGEDAISCLNGEKIRKSDLYDRIRSMRSIARFQARLLHRDKLAYTAVDWVLKGAKVENYEETFRNFTQN